MLCYKNKHLIINLIIFNYLLYDDINNYILPSLSSAPCSPRTFNEDQSLFANAIETGVLPVRTISYNHVIMISIDL